jgi:hypothetical protein
MAFPNNQGNPAAAIPVWIAGAPSGGGATGISLNGSVGTTSAVIIPAGTFSTWVTLQNTHASQTLNVSFISPVTTADISLAAGASITLPFGPGNALNGLGSAAGTTWAAIGH